MSSPSTLPAGAAGPAGLSTVVIADWVDSAVADVQDAGLEDVVVVGYSMAGLTVPGVVARLGSPRAREMIMVSAFIAPQGFSVVDSLRGPLAVLARCGVSIGRSFPMPTLAARFAFWNGMTSSQRRLARARLCLESVAVIADPVDRSDMPAEIPRTWIMPLRDRALSQRRQRPCIDELRGADTVIRVDTCHGVMFSQPDRLAEILIERCELWGDG